MQWSCPHCGIALAITDETLGTGWSFSRCYKCGGFALIRRAEINVIKVDKAPPGERVILPEASMSPSQGLISEKATQKYAKHSSPPIQTQLPISQQLQQTPTLTPKINYDITKAILPDPLP